MIGSATDMYDRYIEFLKKIPIPICGLILALVSLGNLLYSLGFSIVGNVYVLIGSVLMFLVVCKIMFTMKHTWRTLNDPMIASVSPTFSMAGMVICVFLNRLFPGNPFILILWVVFISIHFLLMLFFIVVFIYPKKIELEQIYPSWFITFVGIGVIPTTSTGFSVDFGRIIIWFALFFYIILLPIILKRVFILKKMHESTLPLLTIVTAPGSLCLVGYLSVMEQKSLWFVYLLLFISQGLYVLVLCLLPRLLKIKFYPSYAAFTFPLVISATAVNTVVNVLNPKSGVGIFLETVAKVEIWIALIIVSYVLVRYLFFLFGRKEDVSET